MKFNAVVCADMTNLYFHLLITYLKLFKALYLCAAPVAQLLHSSERLIDVQNYFCFKEEITDLEKVKKNG